MTSVEFVTSTDGTRIACHVDGKGPPLILVHGTSADHSRWTTVLDRLAARFTTYAVDRRGRGDSGDAATYSRRGGGARRYGIPLRPAQQSPELLGQRRSDRHDRHRPAQHHPSPIARAAIRYLACEVGRGSHCRRPHRSASASRGVIAGMTAEQGAPLADGYVVSKPARHRTGSPAYVREHSTAGSIRSWQTSRRM
jgi:hypothetical protein